jgi:hypothetical protein
LLDPINDENISKLKEKIKILKVENAHLKKMNEIYSKELQYTNFDLVKIISNIDYDKILNSDYSLEGNIDEKCK